MLLPEILALAQQGSPKSIAVLINRATQPQGITAQVAKRGYCLHVLLEAEHVPDPPAAVALIRSSLKLLDVRSVHTVMVYARRFGQKAATWQQAILLKSYLPPDSPVSNNFDSSDSASIVPSTAPAAIETSPRQIISTRSTSSTAKPLAIAEPAEEDAAFLKRPEAVILVVFVTLLMFWDMYLSMLDELATGTALTTRRLAERLGTSTTTIRRRRTQPDFGSWSQKLDPDGLAWSYRNSLYVPQVFSEFEDAPAS